MPLLTAEAGSLLKGSPLPGLTAAAMSSNALLFRKDQIVGSSDHLGREILPSSGWKNGSPHSSGIAGLHQLGGSLK